MKKIKKQAIIEYLESLAYSHGFDFWPIGFRIKLDDWAFIKGQCPKYGIENNSKWDEKWEQWLKEHDDFFWWTCLDALSGFTGDWNFLEGHPDKELAQVDYKFYTAGRSGGWLVLETFDCYYLNPPQMFDGWREWNYDDLWLLYKFCKEIEKFVDGRHDEMAYLYAIKRQELEPEWAEEEEEQIALTEENSGISHPVVYPIPQMPLCYFQAIGKPFFLTRKEFGRLTYKGE